MERCLRNALKAGAPVGRTSARAEVTASGAGRWCDEQNFVRSAALGCITKPSGAGKTEIPVKYPAARDAIDPMLPVTTSNNSLVANGVPAFL